MSITQRIAVVTGANRRIGRSKHQALRAAGAPGSPPIAVPSHRSDLGAGVDPDVVVDQLWGACYYRLLNNPDLAIDAAFADVLLDNLWHGIATPAES